LGHDCGHGPAGHASEDALSPYLEGGYHHAVYGADVVLTPLNLCAETLDAVRNHSWNRPAPATPEGEVVAWADRVNALLRQLTEWFIANPRAIGDGQSVPPGSPEAAAAAVQYVSGMTDRFALRLAVDRLGWSESDLPTGV
jgi:dGTPase